MLTKARKSIVLLQGNPGEKLFDLLKKRGTKEIFVLEGWPELNSKSFKKIFNHKITPTLISDNMAASILGVLGKRHKISVNLFPSNGTKTKVSASPDKIFYFEGKRIAPKGIKGYVPLVEWLPKKYITRIY